MERVRATMDMRIRRIIEGTDRGQWPCTAQSLRMLSWGFGLIARTRLRLYDKGVLRSRRLPCMVISIGNLTAGGTGKTPMAMYIARLLQQLGIRVALLSRGYKGLAESRGGVVSDGRRMLMDPDEAGDEPYMMAAKLPGVPVLVGRDRYRSGIQAIRDFGVQAVVLDDAFQHLSIARDLNLLLLDSRTPLGNGQFLPRGPLRMPASSAARADAIIFTRCGEEDLPSRLPAAAVPPRLIFRSRHRPTLYLAAGLPQGASHGRAAQLLPLAMADVERAPVLGFSGIADNTAYRRTLETLGFRLKQFVGFADHHRYTDPDLKALERRAGQVGADWLATTEKDFFRVCHRVNESVKMIVVGTEVEFIPSSADFKDLVQKKLAGRMSKKFQSE